MLKQVRHDEPGKYFRKFKQIQRKPALCNLATL